MKIRHLSQRVWRIGYRPDPWERADWRWAGAGGRFTGRWDALDGGLYRTVYAGKSLRACLIELLTPLRPDPQLVSAMDEITVDVQDAAEHPTIAPGVIDIDNWTHRRLAASSHLQERFCAVSAATTIAALHRHFYPAATTTYGLKDFDAAALKDARPRELTQAVSQYLWNAKDPHTGADLCDGIEFLSRHGDDLMLWAVFERAGDEQTSPHITAMEHHQLTRHTPRTERSFRALRPAHAHGPRIDEFPLSIRAAPTPQVKGQHRQAQGRAPTRCPARSQRREAARPW